MTQTTSQEEIALRLAAAFIRLSRSPLFVSFNDKDTLSKDDVANILDSLALRMKERALRMKERGG